MDKNINEVLNSIFDSDTGYDEVKRKALNQAPNYAEVVSFAQLLSTKPPEENIQQFILNF